MFLIAASAVLHYMPYRIIIFFRSDGGNLSVNSSHNSSPDSVFNKSSIWNENNIQNIYTVKNEMHV